MTKRITTILIFFYLVLSSCDNIQKSFYETGELKEEIKNLDDTCDEAITYYKNGKKSSAGKICNDIKVGIWQEWYNDGEVKWKGKYVEGTRYYNTDLKIKSCILNFKDNPKVLSANITFPFRIKVDKIHPEDLILANNNGIIKIYKNNGEQDFEITPARPGDLNLYIYIKRDTKNELICTKLLSIY